MLRHEAHCGECQYELSGLATPDGWVTCPECGHRSFKFVPRSDTPLRCNYCNRDLSGSPIIDARVWCEKCNGSTDWDECKGGRRGLLPHACPLCARPLDGLIVSGKEVRCPGCGRRVQMRVPDMPWPMRCRKCRRDLTTEPIVRGRVRCPKCSRLTRWLTPGTARHSQRDLAMTVIDLFIIVVAVLTAMALLLWIAGAALT
ncbi:MAG: hypothetical protein IH985_04700 [Planctomycetes bacterium]|nr:hypothetical protein [Planctomycetota bacterium]